MVGIMSWDKVSRPGQRIWTAGQDQRLGPTEFRIVTAVTMGGSENSFMMTRICGGGRDCGSELRIGYTDQDQGLYQ